MGIARIFGSKFTESINTAVVAAFGFLIALVWKDVITEYANTVIAYSPVQGKIISALVVTLIGVIGIMISASILIKK